MKRASDLLKDAAQTYEQRSKAYGDNYTNFGHVMAAMFPKGLIVSTPHDWNRLHLFIMIVVKQTRYVYNWNSGGHKDSIHDLTVYSAMLEEIDGDNSD